MAAITKVNLNIASATRMSVLTMLTKEEIRSIRKFRKQNGVFHRKTDLLLILSKERYEEIKDTVKATTTKGLKTKYKRIPTKIHRELYPNVYTDSSIQVGHIIAQSNGGADCEENYIPIQGTYNRMLSNRYDDIMFAHVSPEKLKGAVRASRMLNKKCKMTYRKAIDMRKRALENIKKYKLYLEGKGKVGGGAGQNIDPIQDFAVEIGEDKEYVLTLMECIEMEIEESEEESKEESEDELEKELEKESEDEKP